MEWILTAGIVLPSLIQGGFYPSVFLMAGILWAILWAAGKKMRWEPGEVLLAALCAVYILASLVNGFDLTSLSQACLPLAGLCFLRYWLTVPMDRRERFLDLLTVCTALMAAVGIAALSGVVNIFGAVTANRLQFPFQYANAAGSWFAAVALIGRDGDKVWWARLPILTALLLTQSVGAIGLYGIILLVLLWRRRKTDFVWETVLRHTVAAFFALGILLVPGPAVCALLALLLLAGWQENRVLSLIRPLRWALLTAGALGLGTALVLRRGTVPVGTFAERLVQIVDGFSIMTAYPVFGTGAGNWTYLYPRYQTAQYVSTVVHCGVIQVGVDAGFLAAGMWIAFLVLALRGAGRKAAKDIEKKTGKDAARKNEKEVRNKAVRETGKKAGKETGRKVEKKAEIKEGKSGSMLAPALLLTLHSLLDFTMQFYPVLALLLALLYFDHLPEPCEKSAKAVKIQYAAVLLAAVLFITSFAAEQLNKQIIVRGQTADWPGVVSLCDSWSFLQGRKTMTQYVDGLYYTGQFEKVLEIAQTDDRLEEPALLTCAKTVKELSGTGSACEYLLSALRSRLYDTDLFEDTAELLKSWDAEETYVEEYNGLAALANDSCTALGTLMGNQVRIEQM